MRHDLRAVEVDDRGDHYPNPLSELSGRAEEEARRAAQRKSQPHSAWFVLRRKERVGAAPEEHGAIAGQAGCPAGPRARTADDGELSASQGERKSVHDREAFARPCRQVVARPQGFHHGRAHPPEEAVGGGGFIFKVYRQKSAENAAFEKAKSRHEDFWTSIKDMKVTSDPVEAQKALDTINEKRNEWKTSPHKGKIQDLATSAAAFLQQDIERKRVESDLADVQAKLANVDSLSGDELNELRRRIDELGQGTPLMGPEFPETLKAAGERIEARYLDALVQDAQKLAASGPEQARAALAKYARAEDEIQKAYGDASTKGDKDRQAVLRPKFQSVCEESDVLANATFTESLIASTPWKDLLSGEAAGRWIASQTPGLNWRVSGGVLEINYPDQASKVSPVLSVGDTERWRDFVLQCEFVIVSPGSEDPKFYFRAPATRIDDNFVLHQRLYTSGSDHLQTEQKYVMTVSLIGSKYQVRFDPEDLPVEPQDLTLSSSRKGGVALAIRGGCQMRITKMQIKELRHTPQN